MTDLDHGRSLRLGDPGGMLDAVSALSDHARGGYAAGLDVAGAPSADGVTALAFCGMGGSAVAGDVLRAVYRERLGIPVEVVRTPVLPAYCGPHTLVVASSYSGNTAETLACFREARDRGCRVIVVTSGGSLAAEAADVGGVAAVQGGSQPRAALGWLAFATIGALVSVGLLPDAADDVDEAVAELAALASKLGPSVPAHENLAKELAHRLGDRIPVIWGAEGIGAVAAARWKTQFNENAKIPAFTSSMSELDHNEVVGWVHPHGEGFSVIALRHDGEDREVAARFPLSLEIAHDAGASVEEFRAAGRSSLAQFFSLIALGDFASVYHALLHGVDPTPVAAIDRLKAALAGGPLA